MSVCYVSIAKCDELFRSVSSIHVQGEHAAVMAAHRAGQTFQLRDVAIPDGAIASQECLDGRNEREDAVRIEIVGTGGPGFEMNC